MKKSIYLFIILALCNLALFKPTLAQNPDASSPQQKTYKLKMRAVSEVAAVSGKTKIILWGISETGIANPTLKLHAQVALDNKIGKNDVRCTLKQRTSEAIIAQCINAQDLDLGLFMLQNGYAVVDRSAIYGTVFEMPYIEAEQDAQSKKIGVWSEDQKATSGTSGNLMLTLGFILFVLIVGAFSALSIFIMRGFQKIIDAQNKNMDMANKERALKEKEREIFANMLDAEIKANKSKIEAYIIVYDEMLSSLQNPESPPRYQTVGDIVQKQPALSRAIFDKNTDKLDFVGNELSSEIIHFYARIKTNAEYVNLEPDMPLEEAQEIVEAALKNAKRLDKASDRIIDNFSEAGLSSQT